MRGPTKSLSVRLSEEDHRRFQLYCQSVRADPGDVLRQCVREVSALIVREGALPMPFAVVGKKTLEQVSERTQERRGGLHFLEAGLLAGGLAGFAVLRLAGRRKAAMCTILAAKSIAAVASIIHSFMLRRGMSTDVAGEPRMVAGESPAPRSIPRMKQSGSLVNSPERGPT